MSKYIVLLFLCVISIGSFSQTTDFQTLCELHQKNLDSLHISRGASRPEWMDCKDIDSNTIINLLKRYKRNVAILLYTPLDSKNRKSDSFNLTLYTKKGIVFNHSEAINKDQLISDITLFNSRISGQFFAYSDSKIPSTEKQEEDIRGLVAVPVEESQSNVSYLLQTILPPEEYLKDIDHLIIVPSLNIATIPFSALQFSDGEYLIDKMSYSIAPSLFEILVINEQINEHFSNLGLKRKGGEKNRFSWYNPLIIENPTYPNPEKYPNLEGTEKEIELISSFIKNDKTTILKGKKATTENVLKNIEGRDLLYFATHGVADVRNALDSSFIVLADQGENSYLTSRTIQKLDLSKTELVVLSACQTGLGQEHEGGIIGLTRAFQIAGAKNILSTLWSIYDSKTPELMYYFFEEMEKGGELMPYEALRQAILRFKKEVSGEPRYWAAFMFFGVPY
ncbi:MAG: CHAT domain-containing protein [Brumimicrobium sp.]|nr:CHAT domain-containing protein [Brumimicrobium sp.]